MRGGRKAKLIFFFFFIKKKNSIKKKKKKKKKEKEKGKLCPDSVSRKGMKWERACDNLILRTSGIFHGSW